MQAIAPPVFKIPLLALAAICTQVCLTPPNPPAKTEEKSKFEVESGVKDVVPVLWITWLSKLLTQAMHAIEIVTILFPERADAGIMRWFYRAFPPASSGASSIKISPTFLVGLVCVTVAAYLRVKCYRHLGRHFTFELSLRKEHKLITDGPYSVVRHPSYTALFIYFAGLVMTLLGSGSWWAEHGIFFSLGRIMGMAMVSIVTVWVIFFLNRVQLEDKVLETNFREQWSAWAKETPYKIFPLVF